MNVLIEKCREMAVSPHIIVNHQYIEFVLFYEVSYTIYQGIPRKKCIQGRILIKFLAQYYYSNTDSNSTSVSDI